MSPQAQEAINLLLSRGYEEFPCPTGQPGTDMHLCKLLCADFFGKPYRLCVDYEVLYGKELFSFSIRASTKGGNWYSFETGGFSPEQVMEEMEEVEKELVQAWLTLDLKEDQNEKI